MIQHTHKQKRLLTILCLWFRASLIYINNVRDATQNSLFIILRVHSTCFVCQLHPLPGVHKNVTTASGTVQLPPSNVAKLGHVGGR